MADKIVQLIDKDGDNIFPISSVPNGAVISMTATDPGEGAALEADHYIGVYGSLPIIMDYSTSEVNTGYKWVDGRAIYQKTIDWGYMPNNSRVNRASQFPNNSLVIKIESVVYNPSGLAMHGMPYVTSAWNLFDTVFVSDGAVGQISVATNTDRSAWKAYITIWYVKP